jgi:nicotinamidase-related amidase
MGMSQFRMAMAWQRVNSPEQVMPWFLRDSPGFQITPDLQPLPSEGVFDKVTMSAFEATWLDFALRDCGINAFIIVGVAMEIGIEPTARHGADLGYIPVIVTDACGAGDDDAAKRSIESLKFAGDTILTDTEIICEVLRRRSADRE